MRTAAAAVALVLGGCGLFPRQPLPTTREGEWAVQRDRFTRSGKIYDRIDDQLFATATYQAPAARLARAERLAEWKAMTAVERDQLVAAERADGEKWEEFLLSVYTPERTVNDLDSPRSVWRLALVVEGAGEMLPVDRPDVVHADATVTGLYPQVGLFDVVYRVRFPRWKGERPLDETPFTLVLAGARGKLELRFNRPAAK